MSLNKRKLIAELEKYFKALNVSILYSFPDRKESKDWLAEVGAILKNLDETDYKTFIDLRKHLYPGIHESTRKHASEQIDVFIRQKIAEYRRSLDIEREKQKQEKLSQLKQQTEMLTKELVTANQTIKKETKKIEASQGERAAVSFGKHFEVQVSENSTSAKIWLNRRNKFFWTLFWIILVNIVGYFYLFTANKVHWWPYFPPKDFFTLEYGIIKFALLAFLSYGLAFCSRNYNIQSNQATSNQHRKNVAETLKDFLNSNPTPEDRAELMRQGTETMFKHLPIGYIPKIESKDDGPVASVLNVLKQK